MRRASHPAREQGRAARVSLGDVLAGGARGVTDKAQSRGECWILRPGKIVRQLLRGGHLLGVKLRCASEVGVAPEWREIGARALAVGERED